MPVTVSFDLKNRKEVFDFYMLSDKFREQCGSCFMLYSLLKGCSIIVNNNYVGFKKHAFRWLNNTHNRIDIIKKMIKTYTMDYELHYWLYPILMDCSSSELIDLKVVINRFIINNMAEHYGNKFSDSLFYKVIVCRDPPSTGPNVPIVRLQKQEPITNSMLIKQKAVIYHNSVTSSVLLNQRLVLKNRMLGLIVNPTILNNQINNLTPCFPVINTNLSTFYVTPMMLCNQKSKLKSISIVNILPENIKDDIMILYNMIKSDVIKAKLDKFIRYKCCKN